MQFSATLVYQADALVQVESKNGAIPLEGLQGKYGGEANTYPSWVF